MAAKSEIIMNGPEFQKALKLFLKRFEADVPVVMREVHRLLSQDIVKRTPPKNTAEGARAIENDLLSMVVVARDPSNVDHFADIAEGGQYDHMFDPDGILLEQWHKDHRKDFGTNRRSRVTNFRSAGTFRMAGTLFADKLHVKDRDFKRYLRRQKRKVGQWKATFAGGVTHFGGSVQAWVARHRSSSSVTESPEGSGLFSISTTGRPKFNPQRLDKIIDFAVKVRARDLNKFFAVRMEAQVKKRHAQA